MWLHCLSVRDNKTWNLRYPHRLTGENMHENTVSAHSWCNEFTLPETECQKSLHGQQCIRSIIRANVRNKILILKYFSLNWCKHQLWIHKLWNETPSSPAQVQGVSRCSISNTIWMKMEPRRKQNFPSSPCCCRENLTQSVTWVIITMVINVMAPHMAPTGWCLDL